MVQQLKSTIVVISQLFNFMNLQPRSDISDTRFINITVIYSLRGDHLKFIIFETTLKSMNLWQVQKKACITYHKDFQYKCTKSYKLQLSQETGCFFTKLYINWAFPKKLNNGK